jgi:hypothetical protein
MSAPTDRGLPPIEPARALGARPWRPVVAGAAVLVVTLLVVGVTADWRARQPDGCFGLELELASPPTPLDMDRPVAADQVLAQDLALSNQVGVTGPMVTITADGRVIGAVIDPSRGVTGRREARLSDRALQELRDCVTSAAFQSGEVRAAEPASPETSSFFCPADEGFSAVVAGPASGTPRVFTHDGRSCAPTPSAAQALGRALNGLHTDVLLHGVATNADPTDVRAG